MLQDMEARVRAIEYEQERRLQYADTIVYEYLTNRFAPARLARGLYSQEE